MNGFMRRDYRYGGDSTTTSSSSASSTLSRMSGPQARARGYKSSVTTGLGSGDFNSDTRSNASPQVDLDDSIQLHLLTETALSDSKQWTILSQEEVDDLKKEIQTTQARAEQARANLAIQTKYRDAAVSMAKLYSAGRGGRNGAGQIGDIERANEAEAEREASERQCEVLISELFALDKRVMDAQRRLMQHTAGILQLTHAHSGQGKSKGRLMNNGMPGSPESMYTSYSNSPEMPETAQFDDQMYFPLDDLPAGKRGIAIPPKSPGREQISQLRDETDKLTAENGTLHEQLERLRRQSAQTEQKMEELNDQLRDMLVRLNPTRNETFGVASFGGREAGESISDHLGYMANGLKIYQEDHTAIADGDRKERIAHVKDVNSQLYATVRAVDPDHPSPPEPREGANAQSQWLRQTVGVLQTQLANSSGSAASKQQAEQDNAVLMGLWDIIQTGYAGIKNKKAERRKTRIAQGLPTDEEDMEPDAPFDINEPYSLPAFSTKVQWLYAQATGLKDQKAVLQRQIKQQRELNSKSDSEKEKEMKAVSDELALTKTRFEASEKEAMTAQQRLADAFENMELLKSNHAKDQSAATTAAQTALKSREIEWQAQMAEHKKREADYKSREAGFSSLQSESNGLRDKIKTVEDRLASFAEQLATATSAKQAAEAQATQLASQAQAKDREMESLNATIVELKTENTFAKAELEGAYGSRSQRAAEAAALGNTAQLKSLEDEVAKLKQELGDTLRELESMTKETMASEKEKLELEGRLDDLNQHKASLEGEVSAMRSKMDAEVSKLKEQLDGHRMKATTGLASPTGSRAGATMLSEQFRATMKEERKQFQQELRDEQMRRRKLEDELRALRKVAGVKGSDSLLSPR